MYHVLEVEQGKSIDVTMSHGCVICDGEVQLRMTAAGGRVCCVKCQWIGSTLLRRENVEFEVQMPPVGRA